MTGTRKRFEFTVVCELPKQTITVWAKDASDAEFKAWQMMGLAGVKAVGTVRAVPSIREAAS